MMIDKVQRAVLGNQIILAKALWMLLHSQGISSQAMLANVSARIKLTRELLEEHTTKGALHKRPKSCRYSFGRLRVRRSQDNRWPLEAEGVVQELIKAQLAAWHEEKSYF